MQTARRWTAQLKSYSNMNDNTNKQTIEYQFGYLRAAITGAMLLRNVQQMKAALGDALDHVGMQSVK
jgi:hypothetical protein